MIFTFDKYVVAINIRFRNESANRMENGIADIDRTICHNTHENLSAQYIVEIWTVGLGEPIGCFHCLFVS